MFLFSEYDRNFCVSTNWRDHEHSSANNRNHYQEIQRETSGKKLFIL